MNCNQCKTSLSEYSDHQFKSKTTNEIEMHLETCAECRREYDELVALKEMLKELPMKELHENFEAELHEKLVKASEEKESFKGTNSFQVMNLKNHLKRNMKRYTVAVAACLVLAVSYQTLNQNLGYKSEMAVPASTEMMAMSYDEAMVESGTLSVEESYGNDSEPMVKSKDFTLTNGGAIEESPMRSSEVKLSIAAATGADGSESSTDIGLVNQTPETSRKMIQSAYVSMDLVDYDQTLNNLIDMTLSMGGYVEDMSTSYQYGYRTENPLKMGHVTIRVPQLKFHGVIKGLESFGQITDESLTSEDITYQYRDMANEVANLEVREAKLREIMEKAVEIKDVLEVESELSRVRGQINSLKGTLIQWDQLVSLSRITINLVEVETLEVHIEPIDNSLIKRISESFINSINSLRYSLENLTLLVVALFPFVVGYSIIGFIGWKLVKGIIRKIKNWRT